MKVRRDNGIIIIEQLDQFLAEMLRMIPHSTNPAESKAAEGRLFSRPETEEGRLNADWKIYVEPELRHLFQTAVEVVETDLKKLRKRKAENELPEYRLKIPASHIEAWLNATNQARLVLAAQHEFSDEELGGGIPVSITSAKELGLFQIHFYGFLQECFLRILEQA